YPGRGVHGPPVRVGGAHRLAGVHASPILTETLAEAAREGSVVQLAGLPESDVARFIEARAGIRPPSGVVADLCRQTGGNPFFLAPGVRPRIPEVGLARGGKRA